MSDYDRGAYTPPTDEPLAFDARTPQRRRPLPMTLIASVVILIVLIGAVIVFYRSGVRGANEPPRVVGTSIAAIKTAAAPEDAKPVADQALDVYVTEPGAQSTSPTFAPAPEQPHAIAPAPATAEPAARPLAKSAAAPATRSSPGPAVRGTAKTAAPVLLVGTLTEPASKTGAAATLRPPQREAPIAPTSDKVPGAATRGSAVVQIGAFGSQAIADQEFAKVRAGFARFVSGKSKRIEPVDRGGHTLYRTAFAGFSRPDATAFCAALKAAGRSCLVK